MCWQLPLWWEVGLKLKGLSQARCELGLFLGSSFGGPPLVWVRSELRVLDPSSKDWSELAPLPLSVCTALLVESQRAWSRQLGGLGCMLEHSWKPNRSRAVFSLQCGVRAGSGPGWLPFLSVIAFALVEGSAG